MVNQPQEVWISAVIANDKACVDAVVAPFKIKVDGVSVAADVTARFKHGNVVFVPQQPGTGQPRDPAADDSNFHDVPDGSGSVIERMLSVSAEVLKQ